MLLLGADTSTSITTTALLANGEVQEINYYGKQAQSSRLFSHLEYLLGVAKQTIRDVDCLALGAGPGSFTGLRILFSAFRSIAQSGDIPIVLVNSLDAMAYPYREYAGTVVVAQFARKGYAYTAFYSKGELIDNSYHFLSAKELETRIGELKGPVYLLGGFVPQIAFYGLDNLVRITDSVGPSAASIVRIAEQKYAQGEVTPFKDAFPVYLRASDAEEQFAQKGL